MVMSRNFTGHNPKPARVTRAGAAPRQTAQAAPPAPTPRPTPTGKAATGKAGKAATGNAGKAPTGNAGKAPTGKAPTGKAATGKAKEIGGPSGPEPTRYGDWERNGICVDF
jgi:hypothetical protein